MALVGLDVLIAHCAIEDKQFSPRIPPQIGANSTPASSQKSWARAGLRQVQALLGLGSGWAKAGLMLGSGWVQPGSGWAQAGLRLGSGWAPKGVLR